MTINDFRSMRRYLNDLKSFIMQNKLNGGDAVRFYNWWHEDYKNIWFYRFVTERGLVPNGKHLNFFSVFGHPQIMRFSKGPIVFYTGENLYKEPYLHSLNYMDINRYADLSLGFDYYAQGNYMRFPWWLIAMFEPNSTPSDIKKKCNELKVPELGGKTKFASLVAQHDMNRVRTQIFDSIKQIGIVSCPSVILHNDDSLKEQFQDDKVAYLKQFFFNICPENSNADGYVTEKCFQAILAGCIPIYCGSNNNPEPEILNRDAMIMWNPDGDNMGNINLIEELWRKPSLMEDYLKQPRIKNDMPLIVEEYFVKLENKIRDLFA